MIARRLRIFPDSDRVEQALVEASRAGLLVDARGACTFAQLVERCEPARFAGRAPASPFVVPSVLTRLAPSLAREAFGDFACAPDFARAASEVISQLKSQNVTVQLLRDAAGRGDGTVRSRGLAIAALWEAVDLALASNGLLDAPDVLTVATGRLLSQGLPPKLAGFDELEIAFVHDLFPARLSFLEALAKACRKKGVRFVLTWPGVGRDEVDVFVSHAIRHIEHRWELDPHDLQLHRVNTPLEWVAEQVFAPEPRPGPAPSLEAFSASSARDEAAEMARRIKRLLQAGTAPEQVAVVYRDLASDSETVLEAFDALDIPLRARLGMPLAASGVGRLAFSVLSLVEDAFPAAQVVSWVSSRYARGPVACEADAARWLAEAGIRDDEVGRSGSQGAYAVRLEALEARLQGQLELLAPGARRSDSERSLKAMRAVAASARALIRVAGEIPKRARFRVMLEAWWRAVEGTGVFRALDDREPWGGVTFLSREIDRALARDQAAAEALRELRGRLLEALDQSGLAQVEVERGAFAHWLSTMAAGVNLNARGPRTGAVWLLDARELAGRRFDFVFLGGLLDGRFPGRAPPLPLLGEDQRKSLNALAKQPLFRLGVAEGDFGLPLRVAEDRLLFHHVLSAASGRVVLSRARFDASGRAVLASPFLDALGRAVEGFAVEEVARSSVPPLDGVASEADLRVRAALEIAGPAETRQTARDGRRDALAEALSGEAWLSAAQARGEAESERLRYFSSETARVGAYSGQVPNEEGLEGVGRALRFDAEHPVSANELKEWANCGFQGLAKRVLNLRRSNVQGEDLDPSGRGSFLHEILRELVPALKQAGLLGEAISDEQLTPLLEMAVGRASEVIERERGTGHPQLWEIAKARAGQVVRGYLASELVLPIDGALPTEVEIEFGRPASPKNLRQVAVTAAFEGESDVYVTGKIDRLDVGERMAGVIDYKSSNSQSSRQRGDALFNPDFQLPLYALAARQGYPGHEVEATWVGLRDREATSLRDILARSKVTTDELLSMDRERRLEMKEHGRPNVANAVHGVLAQRRGGDFGARPIDCLSCEFQSVCRISTRRLAGEP